MTIVAFKELNVVRFIDFLGFWVIAVIGFRIVTVPNEYTLNRSFVHFQIVDILNEYKSAAPNLPHVRIVGLPSMP